MTEKLSSDGLDRSRIAVIRDQRTKSAIPYAKLIGLKADTPLELIGSVEAGFDFDVFVRLQKTLLVTTKQLADLISITDRTLSRRKVSGKLQPDESERLLRLARVYSLAVDMFNGDESSARSWLARSLEALGGKTPNELSKTEVGAREVEMLIHRLEHGVFS